jgi:hypothetical protein
MSGPVPKRSDQRRRQNKPDQPITKAAGNPKTFIPAAPDHWHELAKQFYDSLEESGQSAFYEPSDWAYAQYICEAMSRNLQQGGRMSAQMLQAVLSGMTSLLATEGDRRRMRVELSKAQEADPDETAAIEWLEQYANGSVAD